MCSCSCNQKRPVEEVRGRENTSPKFQCAGTHRGCRHTHPTLNQRRLLSKHTCRHPCGACCCVVLCLAVSGAGWGLWGPGLLLLLRWGRLHLGHPSDLHAQQVKHAAERAGGIKVCYAGHFFVRTSLSGAGAHAQQLIVAMVSRESVGGCGVPGPLKDSCYTATVQRAPTL